MIPCQQCGGGLVDLETGRCKMCEAPFVFVPSNQPVLPQKSAAPRDDHGERFALFRDAIAKEAPYLSASAVANIANQVHRYWPDDVGPRQLPAPDGCRTCRWWNGKHDAENGESAECDDLDIWTAPEFACVHWEMRTEW